MAHTIYRRLTPNGGTFRQITGFTYPAGTTFTLAEHLCKSAGITPKAGDRVQAADGSWGTASSFDLNEGVYTIGVTPDPEAPDE